MKTTFTTLALCLLTTVLSAQELTPFKVENGKWGYIDRTGKEVIPLRYPAKQFLLII